MANRLQSLRGVSPVLMTFLLLMGGFDCSFGCSFVEEIPIELDPEEFVFLGSVAELTSRSWQGREIWGVRVRSRDFLAIPLGTKKVKEYAVYPFELGPDCSQVPLPRDWILEEYPIGSEVWVIGRKLDATSSGDLEAWSLSGSYLFNNTPPCATSMRSAPDYDPESDGTLDRVELRKDLVRLRRAVSERERIAVLKRLAFYRRFRWRPERYTELVQKYLRSKEAVADLLQFYEEKAKARE